MCKVVYRAGNVMEYIHSIAARRMPQNPQASERRKPLSCQHRSQKKGGKIAVSLVLGQASDSLIISLSLHKNNQDMM